MIRFRMAMLVVPLLLTGALVNPPSQALVQPLANQKVEGGCGCSFASSAARTSTERSVIFFAELDGPAWANIAGSDVKLSSIQAAPPCCLQKVGDKVSMRYRGNGAEVVIKANVTWTCKSEPAGESCELFRLRGKLTAITEAAREVLDVNGECGC